MRCQNVAKILSDIVATFWQRSANVVMLQNFKENTNEIAIYMQRIVRRSLNNMTSLSLLVIEYWHQNHKHAIL